LSVYSCCYSCTLILVFRTRSMTLTSLQVKSLKKKLEEVTKDNEDLLCAVKYLKSKMEQKDASSRCATPTVEASRSTSSFGREVHPASLLASADHETRALRDKCATLEREVARLRQRALSEGFIAPCSPI